MTGSFSVPFHFAVEFLVLVVAIGAVIDALRSRRHGAGPWATGQALGFSALGAAQIIHGSLARPEDGDPAVLVLRSIAFGLLALSARPAQHVIPTIPATSAAMAAPAVFLPGAAAGWAVLPAVGAAVVSLRGMQAHRKDQDPTTFAFAAAFISFAAAEAATAFAVNSSAALTLAHGARAAAALFLARWLWTAIVGSVRLRFVATIVVLITVAVLIVSAALNVVIGNTLQTEELKRLGTAGEARITTLRDIGEAGVVTSEIFGRGASVTSVLDPTNPRWAGASGRADQTSTANALAAQVLRVAPSNADMIVLVDRRGRVIGSAEPAGNGTRPIRRVEAVLVAGSDVVSEALDGRATTSAASISTLRGGGVVQDRLVVLSASPASIDGRPVGTIAIGSRIDERFLREIALDTGGEATLIVGEDATDTTFVDDASATASVASIADQLEAFERGVITTSLEVGGTSFPSVLLPVRAADSQLIGFIAMSQRSGAIEAAERSTSRTLFLIALLGLAIGGLLAFVSGGNVTKPIRSLTDAARELQGGNLDARTKLRSRDEVGTLGAAFNEMAEELQRKAGSLEAAASTEATLRSRMESILQSMGDALIATDGEGRVTIVNRAAETILRARPDRLVGKPLGEVLQGTTTSGRRLADAALQVKGAEGMLVAGGTKIAIAMTGAPLRAAGDEVGRVVVIRDMSTVHEAERMKREFLSNVSHELRTPITPIKGYAEILKRREFPREKTEQFLNGVLESTERLERIVEILVDFASLEAGRLKPRQDAVPVAGLLDEATKKWRDRNQTHRFIRKGAKGLPPILGDERLLERAINELLDNAVKFSPDGGTIEVRAEGIAAPGKRKTSMIRISVRDRGIGIEPESMPDLFQDFRQVDGSETRTFGGLGLGLAYVKRIMTSHGGSVEVESDPGKGSLFSLVLPVADGPSRNGSRPKAAATRAVRSKKAAKTKRNPRAKAGAKKR